VCVYVRVFVCVCVCVYSVVWLGEFRPSSSPSRLTNLRAVMDCFNINCLHMVIPTYERHKHEVQSIVK
jgi:hypothetical protein